MEQLDPFKTSDTPFAAYLLYKNHTLVKLVDDPNDAKRKVFVFVKTEETPEVQQLFYEGGAPAEANQYYKSIRIIYRELREHNNDR